MPGFSLLYDAAGTADRAGPAFAATLDAMCHDARYEAHLVYQSPSVRLGWTAYPGYPIRVRESESALLLLEGHIYDPNDHTFESLIPDSPDDQTLEETAARLRDCVAVADGDFAFVYLRKTSSPGVVIAVDSLGRLPVYWHHAGNRLLVSREIKFITGLSPAVAPDRRGIAETLLLRCPLEERTLVSGVSRLPAGGVLRWEPGSQSAPNLSGHPWCFDEVRGRDRDPRELADHLADEFRAACGRRTLRHAGRKMFLSLSGGLDSRAVAAGLVAAGANPKARTFLLGSQTSPQEAIQAQAVAQVCGLPWEARHVSTPSPEAVDRLIHLKDGLNSGEMAHAEEYLNAIIADGGEGATLFTGEGGDVVVVGRHPLRHISTCRELGDLLLERLAVFPPPVVAGLTGLTEEELRSHLATIIERYPESRIPGKQLHFSMMTFQFKEYFEGEDRNRAWLWPVAPFYGRPFFDLAMTAPVAWKRRRRLQSAFLRSLNRGIAAVPNANSGLVPGSLTDRLRQAAREFILGHPALERLRRRHRRPAGALDYPPQPLGTRLALMAESSPLAGEVFDRARLTALCRGGLTPAQMWLVYTILRYLDILSRRGMGSLTAEGP
ncbi:MAG TPA: asparagine synthase-related protein [Acidobacteriota bacterium]|nr:asparagine synthase-related protein [Acidobacteriota bacterium]